MSPVRKTNVCLTVIIILSLAEGSLLMAAGMGNEELIAQLRSDIDLILGTSGVIVTALATTIGILWRSLRAAQKEFISTLKKIHENQPRHS